MSGDPSLIWRRLTRTRVQHCRVFDLDRVRFQREADRKTRDFWVVEAPDWVNVIALTPDRRVVLVRQFRVGIDDLTLEIPGGMLDPGESVATAAARELREETGYASDRWEEVGWVHPNPAIQSNRCYTYVAHDARRVGDPCPDPNESFELVELPLDDALAALGDGRITHALVVAAFQQFVAGENH